jgi:hypothetical protein
LSLEFFRRTILKKRFEAPPPDGIGGGCGQLGIAADRAEFFNCAIFADQGFEQHWALNVLLARGFRIFGLYAQQEIFVRNFRRHLDRLAGCVPGGVVRALRRRPEDDFAIFINN